MKFNNKFTAVALLATISLTSSATATDYDFTLTDLQLYDTTSGSKVLVDPATYGTYTGTSYVAGFNVNLFASNLSPNHAGLGGFAFDVDLAGQTASTSSPWAAGTTIAWFANFDGGANTTDLQDIGGAVDVGVVTSMALLGTAYVDVDPALVDTHIGLSDIRAGAVNYSDQLVDVTSVNDNSMIHINFVPEPTSLALLTLAGAATLRRKK